MTSRPSDSGRFLSMHDASAIQTTTAPIFSTLQILPLQTTGNLLGRLETAFRAQEIAATNDTAGLETLLRQAVSETGTDRLDCSGPAVHLASSKVVPISMIFHELMTNAVKYGAYSTAEGNVDVSWSLEPGEKGRTYLNRYSTIVAGSKLPLMARSADPGSASLRNTVVPSKQKCRR